MRIAFRLRLGLNPVASMPLWCACGEFLDRDPWHAMSCSRLKRRSITKRHDSVLQILCRFASSHGVLTQIEPNNYEGSRPDAELYFTEKRYHTDVSITHPGCPTYRPAAAKTALAAAGRRAKAKNKRYVEFSSSQGCGFTSFVCETYGGFHVDASKLLKSIVDEGASMDDALGPLHGGCSVSLIKQIISIDIQRGNAKIVRQWVAQKHASKVGGPSLHDLGLL